MDFRKEYEEYLEITLQMIKDEILEADFEPMTFDEWHRDNYDDRVENYYKIEFEDAYFHEIIDKYAQNDKQNEMACCAVNEIISKCYDYRYSINNTASLLHKFFEKFKNLKIKNKINF